MSQKLPGKGTTLSMKVLAAFVVIGGRVKIDGPEIECKMRDTTDLDSSMISCAPAIPDPGSVSGTLFFDPSDTTHMAVRALVLNPPNLQVGPNEFKLTYADGKTTPAFDDFKGYVAKFKNTGVEVEGSLQAEFEIRITDLFTSTAGLP